MTNLAIALLIGFNLLLLGYFVVLNSFYLTTSILSFRALRRYARRLNSLDLEHLLQTAGAPPVTVLVPAYNEEANCVASVTSLLELQYPEYDIIVINDGSTDGTLRVLQERFRLVPAVRARTAELPMAALREVYRSQTHPHVWVIDKENGGKSDALNTGLNFCQTPLFCAMDADSVLEPAALMRLVRPFLEDHATVAAGGIIRIANGCRIVDGEVREVRLPGSTLARFQVLEYLRAFLAGRMGWSALDVLLIISGAFGLFRRSAVVEAGGYSTDTVAEDMELVVRLHRHFLERDEPYRISFVPDPVAWTECPEGFRSLARQRDRWQRGLMQALGRHRVMLLNRKYGRIGTVAFPYFWFLEGLGPALEFLGYIALVVALLLGLYSAPFLAAFLVLALVFGGALSVGAVALEELVFRRYTRTRDFAGLLWLAVLENFGYRQLLSFWRFKGVISALRGRQGWGEMKRHGTLGTTAQAQGTAPGAVTPAVALPPALRSDHIVRRAATG
jgi:cellulose synthase/poly-beta-1,6-N-acetylglucosamine synthase-like glycosyltransferase